MGSRSLPVECSHGVVMDWGDFGPDPDDGSVGAGVCGICDDPIETSEPAELLVGLDGFLAALRAIDADPVLQQEAIDAAAFIVRRRDGTPHITSAELQAMKQAAASRLSAWLLAPVPLWLAILCVLATVATSIAL